MGLKVKPKIVLIIVSVFLINILVWFFFKFSELRDNPCLTVDQVKVLDTATLNKKEYVLALMITGWHEKVEYLGLFAQNVKFDDCGKPTIDPLSFIDIYYGPEGEEEIQWPEKIEIKNKQILIHYTKDVKKSKPLVNVPVIWH